VNDLSKTLRRALDPLTIALRTGHGAPPVVCVERLADAAIVAIRLEPDAVVLTVGATAVVETSERVDERGQALAAYTIRDGTLEVSITGARAARPKEAALEPMPLLPPSPRSLSTTIRDAEWAPAEPATEPRPAPARFELELPPDPAPSKAPPSSVASTFSWGDAASDMPTRIGRIGEMPNFPSRAQAAPPASVPAPRAAPQAPAHAASPSPSRPPAPAWRPPPVDPVAQTAPAAAGKAPRIRPSVRRFALIAMLVVTFMLWLHAQRLRTARARAALAAAHAHDNTAATGGSASRAGAASAAASASAASRAADFAPEPLLAPPIPDALASSGAHKLVTPARRAADALSNGDFPGALALYDALAAEPGANPAYAQVAQSLRARAAGRAP
jgi:hypothetical protein